jgi:hypothetical protein
LAQGPSSSVELGIVERRAWHRRRVHRKIKAKSRPYKIDQDSVL